MRSVTSCCEAWLARTMDLGVMAPTRFRRATSLPATATMRMLEARHIQARVLKNKTLGRGESQLIADNGSEPSQAFGSWPQYLIAAPPRGCRRRCCVYTQCASQTTRARCRSESVGLRKPYAQRGTDSVRNENMYSRSDHGPLGNEPDTLHIAPLRCLSRRSCLCA